MTRPTDGPAILVRGLTKSYGGVGASPAVAGIDLEVGAGEAFGLLGPNGAGKTTTVGVCTTRSRPDSGSVRVAGHDVRSEPIRVRAVIGVVTQWNTLDRACSAEENLYFHCRYFGMRHRAATARTAELLERFRLTDKASARPDWLSGGMAQRLQIARAVAHRPRVLFLDEPTSGLDPQSRLSLWDLVDDLRQDGTTVFLTTHYMEEADRLCDRVAILDAGKVLAAGSPAELKRTSAAGTVITARVGRADAGLADRLRALPGVTSVMGADGTYQVATRTRDAVVPGIVAATSGGELQDLSVHEPTLETVFLTLTGRDLRG